MTRAIIHGCNGHMGNVVTEMIGADEGIEAVAGIDVKDDGSHLYPVFTSADDCDADADVVIDFSVAKALDFLFDFCEKRKLPLVLCTTGLSDAQIERVNELSREIPILRSANMSLGINTLLQILRTAAPIFSEAGFDIEIIEKHHNLKLDAPSGTALALADAINEARGGSYHYEYDRSGKRQQRKRDEIGISSIRGGNIVGEHEVLFAGTDEVISFSHLATSKAVFAKGALEAAKFISDASPGLYDMQDVIAASGKNLSTHPDGKGA